MPVGIYFQMYMMSLVIGVGSRLVPWLLGHSKITPLEGGIQSSVKINFLFAAFFIFSYVLEGINILVIAYYLKAVVVSVFFILRWRLIIGPSHRTGLAWSLWMSCWFIIVGLWGSALMPLYHIAFLHIVMIAGLALMTFLISTRVILSHGGYDLGFEQRKTPYMAITLLLLLTATARFAANLSPSIYLNHLTYASVTWIAAVVVWSCIFGSRLFFQEVHK